jgi:hypothetical protein
MPEEYQTKGLLRYREQNVKEERSNNYDAHLRRDDMRNDNPPPQRSLSRPH